MSIKAMLTRPAGVAQYTVGEEIANAVTHGVAALLSIAGLAVLVLPCCIRALPRLWLR